MLGRVAERSDLASRKEVPTPYSSGTSTIPTSMRRTHDGHRAIVGDRRARDSRAVRGRNPSCWPRRWIVRIGWCRTQRIIDPRTNVRHRGCAIVCVGPWREWCVRGHGHNETVSGRSNRCSISASRWPTVSSPPVSAMNRAMSSMAGQSDAPMDVCELSGAHVQLAPDDRARDVLRGEESHAPRASSRHWGVRRPACARSRAAHPLRVQSDRFLTDRQRRGPAAWDRP